MSGLNEQQGDYKGQQNGSEGRMILYIWVVVSTMFFISSVTLVMSLYESKNNCIKWEEVDYRKIDLSDFMIHANGQEVKPFKSLIIREDK